VMRLLADENFNGDILRGLRRRMPAIDAPRIQDAWQRVRAGQHHAGVAAVLQQAAIGAVVADLELRTEAFVARGAQPLGVPGHTGLSLLRDPGGALVALASSPEKWGVHRRSKSCGISSTQTTSLLQ